MTSLRSIIQREIIAVKHALANGIPHEGVACGEDLELLLQDLQAHRAEVIASSKQQHHQQSTNNAIQGQLQQPPQQESPTKSTSIMFTTPKSRADRAKIACPVPRTGAGSSGGGSSTIISSSSNKFARVPIPNSGSSSASSSSSKKRKLQVERDRASATGTTKASEAHKRSVQISPPPPDANKAGPKLSSVDFLRQIRRGIEIGDVLSVLLDVRQPGGWSRQWVRGQVMQTMSRNGLFQIAFDHDKRGDSLWLAKSDNDQDESDNADGEADIKWIHEQRLDIESRLYFCGKGNSPPEGVDETRPKGSWYLHSK